MLLTSVREGSGGEQVTPCARRCRDRASPRWGWEHLLGRAGSVSAQSLAEVGVDSSLGTPGEVEAVAARRATSYSTMAWSFMAPRQRVIQPGRPSHFRLRWPPSRPNAMVYSR